jgi:hypothetical protein
VAVNMLLAPHVGLTLIVVLDAVAWCVLNGVLWTLARGRAASKVKSYSYKIKSSETNINAKLLKS